MSTFKAFALIAPLALSSAALAAPAHVTDAQYIAAARCQGLMASASLGRQDTRGIDALVNAEGGIRTGDVFDRGEEARDEAARAARHAGAYEKSVLVAERDGVCRLFNADATMSAAATPAGHTRTN